MRTKAGCFRVCVGGPWLLVYPEGTWYGGVTPERCERILQEHIMQDKPVEEWAVYKRIRFAARKRLNFVNDAPPFAGHAAAIIAKRIPPGYVPSW